MTRSLRPATTSAVLAALAALTLAACGGPDERVATAPAAPGSSRPSTTTATPGTDAAMATTAPAPTTEPTATPATEGSRADGAAAPAAAPTTTASSGIAPAGDAECLDGSWRADAAELQRRADELALPLAIAIGPDSFSEVAIADGRMSASSQITVSVEVAGTGMMLSASGTSTIEGTYTVAGSVISADITLDTGEVADWQATLNGEPIPLPDGGAFGEPPSTDIDFSGSTFACTDTTLTFDVIGSDAGTITYTRLG